MNLVIRELEKRGHPDPKALDRFLVEHEFPIIEGTTATFVWAGAADEVHLRHWIYGLPASLPFSRLEGSSLWFMTMELPEGSRVEYKLEIVRGDQHQLIQDPQNPHLARDPYGANSVAHGAGYAEPEWAEADSEARPGEIEELMLLSKVYGDRRPVHVYLPARFRPGRRYPLLIAHDGLDYVRFSGLRHVLDNLIHRLEIPPMVVALTQSPNRMKEYANDELHARFLVEELVPDLESRFPLVGTPSSRGLMGASFGGIAALSAAWKHPGFFGNLLLQSGSFAFTDIGEFDGGPVFEPVVDFVNAFRANPGRPAEKLFLSCGLYEPMIYYNRSMVPLLESTGMGVRWSWSRDGHNWESWRDRLREGLSWLFPGPLWMVYE